VGARSPRSSRELGHVPNGRGTHTAPIRLVRNSTTANAGRSPYQLLAVASFAFPEDPRPNGCRPAGTLAKKQPSGAVIFVIEYGQIPPGHFPTGVRRAFPPRPTHFKLREFEHYECFGRSYQLRFREAVRYFQVFASYGRRATSATRRTVVRILNSFTARPR